MRFITPPQWQEWCSQRGVPTKEVGWTRPSISAEGYHVSSVPYPQDSGHKVHLARQVVATLASEGETLVLMDDWAVWPSSQHLPLFTRFREALREHRSLSEAPGHLIDAADADDAVSLSAMALFFFWDCYVISSTGRNAFYASHDEYCHVSSRDASVAARLAKELAPESK
jgi:hypothetical protein